MCLCRTTSKFSPPPLTGSLTSMLTGSPILFATGAIFTFTGILQSPVCHDSRISHKDCWSMQPRVVHSIGSWALPVRLHLHPNVDSSLVLDVFFLGSSVASYGYSHLVSLSGLVMGFVYNAGSFSTPFPLCMLGISSGIELGNFYKGAWIFFAVSLCVLGSKRPSSTHRGPRVSGITASSTNILIREAKIQIPYRKKLSRYDKQ